MPSVVSEAIVLHTFDYLESSRIVRLVTRDAGLRSALARGARKSRRRFGSGLDLFAQGSASFQVRAGRDLDTLTAFDEVEGRDRLAASLEQFTGAETIVEIVLRFGAMAVADAHLFDAVESALNGIAAASKDAARDATLAGAWRIVAALGHAPTLTQCVECGDALDDAATALFVHSAGGVVCPRCATLSPGGRKLPGPARLTIAAWLEGRDSRPSSDAEARAHQRLLREFLEYHVHDGRGLRAFDLWEGTGWSAA
jgi:DNA repair protein RecO (recombination protein O)